MAGLNNGTLNLRAQSIFTAEGMGKILGCIIACLLVFFIGSRAFCQDDPQVIEMNIGQVQAAAEDAGRSLALCAANKEQPQVLEREKPRLDADYSVLSQLKSTVEVLSTLRSAEALVREGIEAFRDLGNPDALKRSDHFMHKAGRLMRTANKLLVKSSPAIEQEISTRQRTNQTTGTFFNLSGPVSMPQSALQANQNNYPQYLQHRCQCF